MVATGAVPNVVVWNSVLHAWSKSNLPNAAEKAEALFKRMKASGVEPNEYAYSSLMQVYASRGDAERAEAILGEMVATGAVPNVVVWNNVLHAWSKSNLPNAAEKADSTLPKDEGLRGRTQRCIYIYT